MKFKDIKKQIKNEIDAHSPSFESVLSKCKKESTEKLQKEICLVPAMAGAPTRLHTSRSIFKYALPIAIVAILAIALIIMLFPQEKIAGGHFIIDINPSLEISYNKDGKVSEATALNEDAEVLLYELELVGKGYTEAIELIVDNCVALGFLSPQRNDNAILTTAISEQGVKDEKMTEKIKEIFSDTLTQKNVIGEILTGEQSEELNKEAEKYGIDGQKLSLIQKYIEIGGEIEEAQYREISIRELYHSISKKEKDNKADRIDNLKNEATQLEGELFDKMTGGIYDLKELLPEDCELKNQLDEIIDSASNEGVASHIDSLLEMLTEIENSGIGFIISDLKSDLENKKERLENANQELKELNKTIEEKKNDRLNDGSNKTEKPQENQNNNAHFPKEDEHLVHTKDDEKEPSADENGYPRGEENNQMKEPSFVEDGKHNEEKPSEDNEEGNPREDTPNEVDKKPVIEENSPKDEPEREPKEEASEEYKPKKHKSK